MSSHLIANLTTLLSASTRFKEGSLYCQVSAPYLSQCASGRCDPCFQTHQVSQRTTAGRRFRKCPYRQNRINRTQGSIPPSTRARWELKLRILNWLSKIYPISHVVVEDIKAWTRKGSKRWNSSFSPLEVGKQWFYDEIERRWILFTKAGYETKQLRDTWD